jgi:sugar phosphate isomerase/epimerase
MKLGLLTAAFPDTPLTEVADWAAGNGFQALEVACWPRGDGAARRYAGVSHIDVAGLSDAQAKELVDDLAGRGIQISGLGYYPNPLHPDPAMRTEAVDHLRVLIAGAARMGVPVVNTFVGADATRPLRDNIEAARRVLPDLVAYARDHGVKLAIENCPMIFSQDEWPGGHNLFYAPATWREIFDIERVVREFGSRLHHVHAKDLQIDREGLYEHGIMSAGIGWQVPRLPGLGEVRWDRFLAALYAAGYDGCVVIEHEDRGFEGSDERVKAGFLLARDAVGPYVV